MQKAARAKRIALVGGGAGGVELTLAIQHRLRSELRMQGRDPNELNFHLFTSTPHILPTHSAGVRRSFEAVLTERPVSYTHLTLPTNREV